MPWREIVDTRNRVAHGYLGISPTTVWDILNVELPALEPLLRELLARMPPTPTGQGAPHPSSRFWNTSPACSRRAWNLIFGQLLSMARSSGAYSTSTVGASTAS